MCWSSSVATDTIFKMRIHGCYNMPFFQNWDLQYIVNKNTLQVRFVELFCSLQPLWVGFKFPFIKLHNRLELPFSAQRAASHSAYKSALKTTWSATQVAAQAIRQLQTTKTNTPDVMLPWSFHASRKEKRHTNHWDSILSTQQRE